MPLHGRLSPRVRLLPGVICCIAEADLLVVVVGSTSVHQPRCLPVAHQIFIVEDHPVMRQGYAYLIDRQDDLETCGEAESASEAIGAIAEAEPDLVMMDLSLEGTSGIELTKQLQSQWPDLPILVVSVHDETLYAERALRAGARGYIMKSRAGAEVITGIRRILKGQLYLSDTIRDRMLHQYLEGSDAGRAESELDALTDRELEVFENLGQGLTTKEVADAMNLSPRTVGTYRRRIMEKLNIESSAELVRRAVEQAVSRGL